MSNPRFDTLSRMYHIEKRRCDFAEDYKKCTNMDYDEIETIMHMQREEAKQNILKMLQ